MDEPSPEDVAVMAAFLERRAKARSELEAHPYDGVRGLPPDWVPEPTVTRFRELRNRLIEDDGWTPEQLAGKLDTYTHDPEQFVFPRKCPAGRPVDPYAFFEDIGFLANLRYCASLEPQDGLRKLGGQYAVKGLSASMDRKRGADETNAVWAKSKKRCIEWAAEVWASNPEQRIGIVSSTLHDRLIKERLRAPETPDRIRDWLKDAARLGKLEIPPQAQQGGRPRK